jgi:hypothetical protein
VENERGGRTLSFWMQVRLLDSSRVVGRSMLTFSAPCRSSRNLLLAQVFMKTYRLRYGE